MKSINATVGMCSNSNHALGGAEIRDFEHTTAIVVSERDIVASQLKEAKKIYNISSASLTIFVPQAIKVLID